MVERSSLRLRVLATARRTVVVLVAVAGLLTVMAGSGGAAPGDTTRVSVSSSGAQANDYSFYEPSTSAGGRFVAFSSFATNLVKGDTNRSNDIFVRDRQTGSTRRVSVSGSGAQGNTEGNGFSGSSSASISPDGRFVAFRSNASNLVASDTNDQPDVFVRDRRTGSTERVSVSSSEAQTSGLIGFHVSVSADGRFVAFSSSASNLVKGDTNGSTDVFVRDRQAGSTQRVSVSGSGAQANGFSVHPSMSADGRFVAFPSDASNLVEGDNNDRPDIFVRDRRTGSTERSGSGVYTNYGDGSSEPSISADGRFVAFLSSAPNLVEGDTNGRDDVFVRDRQTGSTQRVSVSGSGAQGNDHSGFDPSISADGRFVAFLSSASVTTQARNRGM